MSYFIRVRVWANTSDELEDWRDKFLEYTSKDPYTDEDARLQPETRRRGYINLWILTFKIKQDDGSLVTFDTESEAKASIRDLEKYLPKAFYEIRIKQKEQK